MSKTLQMVSHQNYILNANEDFLIFFKSQSIAWLLSGSECIYISFSTLKVKCTQYGFCGQATLKNSRVILYLKLGGMSNNLQLGSKKFGNFSKGYSGVRIAGPNPYPRKDPSPWTFVGGGFTSTHLLYCSELSLALYKVVALNITISEGDTKFFYAMN